MKYEELSEAERKKAHRERCYKLVSLAHAASPRALLNHPPPQVFGDLLEFPSPSV